MMPRDLIYCQCNSCGVDTGVSYDRANDYYICDQCHDKEEEEAALDKEEEE